MDEEKIIMKRYVDFYAIFVKYNTIMQDYILLGNINTLNG